MTGEARKLGEVYALASGGDPQAFAWLMAFHGWAHAIDDFVDEDGHFSRDCVDLCADGVVLCSSPFYRTHAESLGPLLGIVAEQYTASNKASGVLADCLRIAGNQVVLTVAYLRGGRPLLRAVSERLWPIVQETQLVARGGGDK